MNVKRYYLFLIALATLSLTLFQTPKAQAQSNDPTAFQVQQFRPWGDPRGLWQNESAQTLGQWTYAVGFFLNYGLNPLVLRDSAKNPISYLVGHQIGADLVGGIGLLPWLDVYLRIPFTVYQVGSFPDDRALFPNNSGQSTSGFFLSDMQLGVKFGILKEKKQFLNLGAKIYLGLPTAQLDPNSKNFNGEETVSFGIKVTADKKFSIVRAFLNFGYRFNPETTLLNLTVSHELYYGLGAGIDIIHRKLDGIVEFAGAANVAKNASLYGAPMSIYLGARYYPLDSKNLAVNLGFAFPFSPGYGIPIFRVLAGVVWSPIEVDTDKDGLLDPNDRCPKTPGPRENMGCPWPDTDKDGLIDPKDRCPKTPGPKENNGCPWPDTDKDGIPDKDDRCPKIPGVKEFKGCPDTDGDGIPDPDDLCPKLAGPKEFKGCPDTDKDGLHDKEDRCPKQPGPKHTGGCPLAIKKEKKIVIMDKIYFKFNSSRIMKKSYPVLDAVAKILKENPKIHIRIEGHTDDVGSFRYNMRLSYRRARAVRRYLIRKGISPRRMVAKGYGSTRPLVRAKTAEARAKNRRVEFIITKQ